MKSFGAERTFGDSSLLVSLTLWDTPVLFTPPLPFPQIVLSSFAAVPSAVLDFPVLVVIVCLSSSHSSPVCDSVVF